MAQSLQAPSAKLTVRLGCGLWTLMADRLALALVVLSGVVMSAGIASGDESKSRPVNAADVARFPAPGTVVPGSFAFTTDGKALTYLKSETHGPSRVLWRVEVAGKEPRVIARPPGRGNTDSNVSQAEALRRERMRLRDTGITQVVHAEKADVAVIPLQDDLYLLRGDGPLERLTNTKAPEIDPRLTPDGSKLAFVRDEELHVLDLVTKTETQLSHGSEPGLSHALAEFIAQEEMDRFAGYWWAPDGARIAYQETDERHIPLFSIVHQGDISGSVETHRYPFAGKPDAKIRLGVIPSLGGKTTWLSLAEPNEDFYLARVNWENPRSLLVQVLTRDQKALRLYRFEAETGARTLVVEERSDSWVNLHSHLNVIEKTGEFLWSSETTGFRRLELRDHAGKLIRALTPGNQPVDDVLALDETRREVWFSAAIDNPCELQVYRVSLDGGPVTRVTNEPGTHQAVVSRNGETFVDVASDLGHPPVTTLRDRSGKILFTLDDAGKDSRLSDLRLDPPILTEYKARDGITLFGAYYAPRSNKQGDKVPLVVLVYGGPHVQRVTNSWATTADMTAQLLASRGFAVWKTDNRGSSRRGLAFESAIDRNLGSIEVRDQKDGVAFAAACWPEVDGSRVGVSGGSYGGYMTLRCLEFASELFKAGVAIAPVTDWEGYDTCYTERYMGTPRANPKAYLAASVLPHVEKITGSLLLIHGLLDENVHYGHSARLTNALIAAERPFEILPLPDSRHSSRREADRKYVAERTARFFENTLKSPTP